MCVCYVCVCVCVCEYFFNTFIHNMIHYRVILHVLVYLKYIMRVVFCFDLNGYLSSAQI